MACVPAHNHYGIHNTHTTAEAGRKRPAQHSLLGAPLFEEGEEGEGEARQGQRARISDETGEWIRVGLPPPFSARRAASASYCARCSSNLK